MKLARLLWKNAIRNRRRTALTILSITVSMFLVNSLQAILDRLDALGRGSDTSNLRLVVHRATSIMESLPIAYQQRIAALPGVAAVGSWTWFGGLYIDERNFFANFAVDVESLEKTHVEYEVPTDQREAWKRERSAALVGQKLMEKYGWQLGDRITLQGTIYPVDLEFIIRAVYTAPEDAEEWSLFFHWEYFDESLGRPGRVGSFAVKAASPEDVPRLMDAIDRMFRNTDAETKTETEQAFSLGFVSMLGNVRLLLNAISLGVVFTILLVSGNTMAMSIRERTGEVAVLKTLGFRRSTVLLLLVGESLLVALLGGLLGSVGAKTTYAFIRTTSTEGLGFATVYAAGVALLTGYGTWMLFASSSASRGWLKVARIAGTALGSLAGLGAGLGFYFAVAFVMNQGLFLSDFQVSYGTLVLGLGVAAVVGILSAALPALRASRMSIAEALRYVG